jgi:FkbM family methyltransferase
MLKVKTFYRYFTDFLQFGQLTLVFASVYYLLTKKSFIRTRLYRSKLGCFLHRKGSIDFQFGNYAYEWNVKQFINKHAGNYAHFIDVGANIGTYSIFAAKRNMKVIAFEPIYDNFKALTINLMLNNLEKKVKCFNVGLSDKATEADFMFDPLNTGASHMSSINTGAHEHEMKNQHETVRLITMDEALSGFRIPASEGVVLKIDVEGMEIEVLKGGTSFIKEHQNILLVIESLHSGEQAIKETLNEIASFEYLPIDNLNFAARKIN